MKAILLIEDTADILDNLTEYLEMEGYAVIVATNGKRGVELAIEFIPDLVICDVLMREMDGHEVLRQLLLTPATNEIQLIFSISRSEKFDKSTGLRRGADDYIIKPFEPENLLRLAEHWIASGSNRKKIKTIL